MLKGDLTRFSPGDLLTFLSHLNQDGVLTVSGDGQSLNIYFEKGNLVAAHSEQADGKVLGWLRASGLITAEQFLELDQACRETGLSLRQILKDSEIVDLEDADSILKSGIHEVIFQLFTWGTGEFQFNEVSLDESTSGQVFDCTGLALDAARQVDEYREFLRNIVSEDLVLFSTEAGKEVSGCADEMRFVLHRAHGKDAVRQVVRSGPFTSFAIIKTIEEALQKKWIELRPASDTVAAPEPEPVGEANLFLSFKRSTLKVLQAEGKQQQISELISYCRDHFDYFILFAFRQEKVVRCLRFQRDEAGRRLGVELPCPEVGLESDATFRFVCESQTPFFGKATAMTLLKEMGEPDPTGECAIIPLGGKADENFLLFVSADDEKQIPGPLHYLEMISWQIHAPRPTEPVPAAVDHPDPMDTATPAETMVAAVNELPPMPHVVTKVMDLLSDPNSQMSEMIQILSLDPTLVARLIRVSNSALYGRGQETTSLGQAVVRLGAKTVRSLVMAASMKSLFPLDRTNVGVWGQTLWQHSVECGLASRKVAQAVGYPDPEEAFVGGVLHDMGKVVVLLHKSEEFRQILKRQVTAKESSTTAEMAVLGFDHTDVGQLLLEKWQIPGNLQACVKYHHNPSESGKDLQLVQIVAAGNYLSHAFGSQADIAHAENPDDFQLMSDDLGLTPGAAQELLEEIGSCMEHSGLLD